MPKKLFTGFLFFVLIHNSVGNVFADFSCSASVSPSIAILSTYTEFSFQINNTGSTEINWVGIRPDENFGLVGYSSDWLGELSNGEMYFRGGTISSSDSKSFGVNATAGSNELTASWTIEASEAYGGEMISCGSVEVVISAYQEPTATPTSVPGATATPTSATSASTNSRAASTSTPKPTDIIPPVISLNFDFSKPFLEAPKITGIASDTGLVNPGVAKIEYSTDDGKNWLPVDNLKISKNKSSATFEFTPVFFEDGNYSIKARATDLSGNKGVSRSNVMVIDRLPPQVGPAFISFGPQALLPDVNGNIYAISGLNQKITLSAVGGPIEISLVAGNKTFELKKNADNGLWSGDLFFDKEGQYSLIANSKDGAGNITKREIYSVTVFDPGFISNLNNKVKDATVSIFYLEPESNEFVLWDAASYGQKNPQKTDESGEYGLFLPPGSYYIQVIAPGFRTFKSDIFKLDKSLPITSDLKLEKAKAFNILGVSLPFPDFTITEAKINLNLREVSSQKNALIGKQMPEASLKNEDKEIETSDFRGKPFVITLLNTWLPGASSQIEILEKISNSDEFNIAVIIPQESKSKVGIYKKRGGYQLPIYADPDGTLVTSLNLQSLPTHVFLDRTGKITDIKTGILSEEELKNNAK